MDSGNDCCIKKIFLIVLPLFFLSGKISGQTELQKVQAVEETLIFPLQPQHAHASSIVSLPNGDILAVWYQGSGEREANDVKIMGARLKNGSKKWSIPFLMADAPNLPDCNPVVFLNRRNTLFLVWITVLAHRWEYSLLRYRTSKNYLDGDGPPAWNWQGDILLVPDDRFGLEMESKYNGQKESKTGSMGFGPRYGDTVVAAGKDPAKRGIGWMTRIKPLFLPGGRTLLPLYSDGYSMSLIAISDDDCDSWYPSLPIVGRGDVQPALVQAKNGQIVAYMRDNGEEPGRVQISQSADSGFTWSAAVKTGIPNTASVELMVLHDGRWAFVGDDVDDGRYRLSIYLSDDEGRTWKWKRTLENVLKGKGSFSYPCVIQTVDGLLHISYSYSLPGQGESIKYVVLDPAMIK
jgi:predicted neuraminidase